MEIPDPHPKRHQQRRVGTRLHRRESMTAIVRARMDAADDDSRAELGTDATSSSSTVWLYTSWLTFGLLMDDGIRPASAFRLKVSVPIRKSESIRLCRTFLSVTHFGSLPSVPSDRVR